MNELDAIRRRGVFFLLDELYSDRGLLDLDYRGELEKMIEKYVRDDYKTCNGCGAQIVFLKTQSGKWNPVDAVTVEKGDEYLDLTRHTSHFASCSKANDFRKKKAAGVALALLLCLSQPVWGQEGESLRPALEERADVGEAFQAARKSYPLLYGQITPQKTSTPVTVLTTTDDPDQKLKVFTPAFDPKTGKRINPFIHPIAYMENVPLTHPRAWRVFRTRVKPAGEFGMSVITMVFSIFGGLRRV